MPEIWTCSLLDVVSDNLQVYSSETVKHRAVNIPRELDTKHYNGSILRIYKLGSLTITDLCNNGFLLMVLVYALVNIY